MSGTDPRDSRAMVSPRRSGGAAGPSRSPAARDPGAPPPLSTMRRAGVAVVVGALLVSIILAMGGTGRRGAVPDPTAAVPTDAPPIASPDAGATRTPAGPVPAAAPAIEPPSQTVLTVRKITLAVTIPSVDGPLRSLELRVYRNGEPAMDPLRVRGSTMTVKDIPLRRNQNRIEMALANASGEGPWSEPVVVTVDDKPPKLEVKEPSDGSVVNSTLATVRGITEPGLTVTVRNTGFGATEEAVADDRGVFITEIRLDKETNRLDLETTDAAGNRTKRAISVVRGDAEAAAELTLSKSELRLADLPQAINIRLEVRDPDGRPKPGALVSFTLSPPGQETETFQATTTQDGTARWDGVLISGSSKGNGYVTARAVLGGGVADAVVTKPLRIK